MKGVEACVQIPDFGSIHSIRNHQADGGGGTHLESHYLSPRRQRHGRLCEFEVSLVYILSSNLPVLHSETLSQKKRREATLFSESIQTTLLGNSHRECFAFECARGTILSEEQPMSVVFSTAFLIVIAKSTSREEFTWLFNPLCLPNNVIRVE